MDALIKHTFWTDSRLEEQSPEIKLTCLWLVTNPSRDLLGMTRATNKRFTFETGLDAKFLQGACKALPSSFREIAPGVFFAVNFLRHQFGKGGRLVPQNKVIVAVMRQAAGLPKPLASPFYGAYPELLCFAGKEDGKEADFQSPLQAPSEKSEGVREEKSKRRESSEEGMQGGEPDVPGIVALYPRREGVMAACTLVRAAIAKGADPEAIASGTRAHAAAIQQLPGGHLNKFVRSAESFFRDRRWEDDPQTILREAGANGAPRRPLDLGGRANSGTTIKLSRPNKTPV